MGKVTDIDGLREKPKKGEKLGDNHMETVLKRIFPDTTWICNKKLTDSEGNDILYPWGKTITPDFVCHELKMIVEVDGDGYGYGHRILSKIVIDDVLRDEIYASHGYKVVRIPSYVQLDNVMLLQYFNKTYPTPLYEAASMHGFAHSQIPLPADYCELGVERFEREINELPLSVRREIVKTLVDRKDKFVQEGYTEEQAKQLVLPKKLFYLFDSTESAPTPF